MSESLSIEPRPAPKGWVLQDFKDGFAFEAGPFYFRADGSAPGVGFFSEPRHANLGGIVHGGALLTLADMALFDACFRTHGRFRAVTVTLNSEFLEAGKIGEFIEARGELVGGGRSIMFVRGLVTAGERRLLNFSGAVKRLG
jgi:acyl-coenzyme A thioesterase PaaI-like protein